MYEEEMWDRLTAFQKIPTSTNMQITSQTGYPFHISKSYVSYWYVSNIGITQLHNLYRFLQFDSSPMLFISAENELLQKNQSYKQQYHKPSVTTKKALLSSYIIFIINSISNRETSTQLLSTFSDLDNASSAVIYIKIYSKCTNFHSWPQLCTFWLTLLWNGTAHWPKIDTPIKGTNIMVTFFDYRNSLNKQKKST